MPGYQTVTVNYDTIRSITHPKVAQKISDNITAKIPLIHYLDKAGVKELENGGSDYQIPVFKELSAGQAYSGNEVLPSAEPDHATVAIYKRKLLTVPIEATGESMLKNTGRGPEAVVDYLTFLVEAAQESMKSLLGGSSQGIFSSNNESDKGVTGLQTILGTNASTLLTTGTVGGLSRASNTWWRQYNYSVATGFNTNGLIGLRDVFFNCGRGDETPSLAVFTITSMTLLHRAMTGTINYNQPVAVSEVGDVGWPVIKFMGMDCIADSNVAANTIYVLMLKYFRLLVHADRDMSIREWIAPASQDAILARIFWAGNLICSNLARQGMISGLPDTNA